MPKNCRRTLRRFIFVLNSCVHVALRKVIVRASSQIVSSSSLPRVIIGAIVQFSPHEDNTKETRSSPIVLGRQHDYVKPSQCRHVAIVSEYDDIEMGPRCRRRQPNLGRSSVSHVSWLRGHIKGQPQSIFLIESWATLQSRGMCNSHNHNSVPAEWHILMMRQPGKRRQQHYFFWCTSENMMSNSYRPSTSSYR